MAEAGREPHDWAGPGSPNEPAPSYLAALSGLVGGRPHRLAHHAADAAAVAQAMLRLDPALLSQLSLMTRQYPAALEGVLPLLFGLHDVGKLSDVYQECLAGTAGGAQPLLRPRDQHESLGLALLEHDVVPKAIREGWLVIEVAGQPLAPEPARELLAPWLRAVTGHHGLPPARPKADAPVLLSLSARAAAVELAQDLAALLPPATLNFADGVEAARVLAASAWAVAALALLADWLASNAEQFPPLAEALPLAAYYSRIAGSTAERVVTSSGLLSLPPARSQPLSAIFPEILSSTPLQELASAAPIGDGAHLFLVEDVSGTGRSAAALLLAHRLIAAGAARGVFVALPALSLATPTDPRWVQVARRLFATGVEPSIIFGHARPLSDLKLFDGSGEHLYATDDDPAEASGFAWLSDPSRKALLASVGVGTLDQVLLGVLPASHAALRAFALSRSVVVIDQLLPSDPATARLVESMLEFQAALGGSAIVVSGGLPVQLRQRLIDAFRRGLMRPRVTAPDAHYPVVTALNQGRFEQALVRPRPGESRPVQVQLHEEATGLLAALTSGMAAGRAVGWIRNSVADAVEAYDWAVGTFGRESVMLLHERFTVGDRLDLERDAVASFGPGARPNGRRGKLLITTQAAEASLELTFDELVTDLAPIDVLLQRFGRLARHRRDGRRRWNADDPILPTAHVLAPQWTDAPPSDWFSSSFPASARVYPEQGQLWLTARVLRQRGGVLLPDDVRWLLESVYDAQALEEIPHTLWRTSDQLGAHGLSEIADQRTRPLSLWSGFQRLERVMLPDCVVPGPMGQLMTVVRLGRFVGGMVLPFHQRGGWELSQVLVPIDELHGRGPSELDHEISVAEGLMPDRGRFGITLVMSWDPEENRSWCQVVGEDGVPRIANYDSSYGLWVRP